MTRLLATLVILSLALTFLITAGQAQTEVVEIEARGDNTFSPDEVTITAGTTVRWVNVGGYHTVTSTDSNQPGEREPSGSFDEELPPDETFEFTFTEPGTYLYYCKPHANLGMDGTITVTEATGNGDGDGDDTDGSDDTEGAPAPGFALLLAGLAALVLVHRRR